MLHLRRRLATSTASATSLAGAVGAAPASALALLAPQQAVSWTYEELDLKARKLACGLEDLGYKPGSVIVSNLPNTAENLLLQVALAHVGAAITGPPKDDDALAGLAEKYDVRGVACIDGTAPPLGPTGKKALPTVYLEVPDGLRPASRGAVAFTQSVRK